MNKQRAIVCHCGGSYTPTVTNEYNQPVCPYCLNGQTSQMIADAWARMLAKDKEDREKKQ